MRCLKCDLDPIDGSLFCEEHDWEHAFEIVSAKQFFGEVKNPKCIICEKDINIQTEGYGVMTISFGYGSLFDNMWSHSVNGALICDECVEKKKNIIFEKPN